MLFGLKKKKDKREELTLPRHLCEFLNKVDEEYMRAYATKSIKPLRDLISRDCAVVLSRVIFSFDNKYFGTSKFRKTVWTLLQQEGDCMLIQKKVRFDKVKIGGSMKIGVADDYIENWSVDLAKGSPIVTGIESVIAVT